MAGDEVGQGARMQRARVQRGNVIEARSTRLQEVVAVLDVDFLDGLEAVHGETRADDRDAPDPAPGQRFEQVVGVGLEPLAGAILRLEGNAPLAIGELEFVRQQAGRPLALAEVRVALVEIPFGDTMEGHHELFGPAVACPVVGDRMAQRFDVAGMVGVLRDEPQFRHPAPAPQFGLDLVVDRSGRHAAVLWEQRKHQDLLGTRVAQARKALRDPRLRVQHAELHRDGCQYPFVEAGCDGIAQPGRQAEQRRAFCGPYAAVLARAAERPRAQDDAVQDRQPERARQFDHARVPEQARQEAAHVRRRG